MMVKIQSRTSCSGKPFAVTDDTFMHKGYNTDDCRSTM